MPSDPFGLIGHAIEGQFHVLEVAGEGGFGVVYRGQHLTLREPIAIKCLKLRVKSKNPQVITQFTQRFFDESRIMYRLSQGNLNIVRAITTGVTMAPTTGETVPYMVLEWLEGSPMSKELKERRQKKLPPPPLAEVVAQFEPAALAIAYAHSQGVVHRDLKPGNLFLQTTREGPRMKVLDFGMAKVLSPEAMGGLASAETIGGVMVMSPQYVTPEQLDKVYGAIGPWTDVYSFALILVEALTNRRAREAEAFADLMLQISRDPPPTPMSRGAKVSPSVDRVFSRALARDPKQRYTDVGAFWRELKNASLGLDDEPVDQETYVDMQVPAQLMARAMAEAPRKPDFSSTLRIDQRVSAVPSTPAAGKFSGTVPLQAFPEQAAARAALEAVRPSVPQPTSPAASSGPYPAPPISAPILSPPRQHTPPQPPVVQAPPQSTPRAAPSVKRRANPVLVVFLLLFVLASFAASGLLLARLYVR